MTDKKQGPLDDVEVAQRLVAQAKAEGVSLTGPGGLLGELTRRVLETALEGEVDEHLGYPRHDPAGAGSGNSRNGKRARTVVTEVGPIDIEVPRDRDGSFDPKIVRKRQRRLDGIDELVLSLSAKGLTTGEVSAHLAEVYGAQVSKDTISNLETAATDIAAANVALKETTPSWTLTVTPFRPGQRRPGPTFLGRSGSVGRRRQSNRQWPRHSDAATKCPSPRLNETLDVAGSWLGALVTGARQGLGFPEAVTAGPTPLGRTSALRPAVRGRWTSSERHTAVARVG